MNRFGGNFGQGLLGNPPVSSNYSPQQNRFQATDTGTSYNVNQDVYFGDGGGYARDLGDNRNGSRNEGYYNEDIDMRGGSYQDQTSSTGRYGDRDRVMNRGDVNMSHGQDFRNEEEFYSGRNSMTGARQDRLSGGGGYSGDDRGSGATQDQFNRLGMGGISPGVMSKGQGLLGSGPVVGGDTDFRSPGAYSGMGNQSRAGNMQQQQGVGNLAMSQSNIGGQGMRPQQGGGMGIQMAGMEANLMALQKQQQQQEALLRDTQLQMVNNLLLQQQSKRGNQLNPGFGGTGLLGNNPQSMTPGMMGGPGGNQRGSGPIPSLLDISTKKPQGKRGYTGPRDQGGFKKQRMTPQKHTPDRRHDNNNSSNRGPSNNSNRGPPRRHSSQDRQRSSDGGPDSRSSDSRSSESRSSAPRRKESDDASSTPARSQREAVAKSQSTPSTASTEKQQQSPVVAAAPPNIGDGLLPLPATKPKQTSLNEKYDPEEPTEDEIIDIEAEAEKESIQVIDMTDEPQPTSSMEGVEDIEDVTVVKVEKRRDEKGQKPKEKVDSSKKLTNFFCHVCSTECRDAEGFAKHMNGMKHKNRMESIMGQHMEKSNQLISRIKAEEHLRKIESSPRDEDRRRSDGDRRRSRDGRDRHSDSRSRRGRHRSSDMEFPDIGDLVTLDTVGFEDESGDKEAAEKRSKEKSKTRENKKSDKPSGDVEMKPIEELSGDSSVKEQGEKKEEQSMKQAETIANASKDSENAKSKTTEKKEGDEKSSKQTETPKHTGSSKTNRKSTPSADSKKAEEKSKDEKSKKSGEEVIDVDKEMENGSTQQVEIKEVISKSAEKDVAVKQSEIKDEKEVAVLPECPVKTPSIEAKKDSTVTKTKEGSVEVPEYSPDAPIGQKFIVPVTGYYCKLCSKFYNNEKAAKETHCQTRSHYDKYKASVLGTSIESLAAKAAKAGVSEKQQDPAPGDKQDGSTGESAGGGSPAKRGKSFQGNKGQRGRRGRK